MPASLPPNLVAYTVVGAVETPLALLDFGTGQAAHGNAELGPVRIRLYNEEDPPNVHATALSPVCYIGGTDASVVGNLNNPWTQMQNIDNNGVPVSDDYEPVSNSYEHGSKPLPGPDIEPDTYVTFDVQLTIPQGTLGGQYEWEYIIEYLYTT